MSAILAAVMSTLSCQLLVCSSTLTEDFYRQFIRPKASHRELIWVGRSMVLAISVLSVWMASDPDSLVLSLVSYAWGGFGAAFGPVILISVWWKRMTRNGALDGARLEPLRMVQPLRNSAGLRLRLDRDLRREPSRQDAAEGRHRHVRSGRRANAARLLRPCRSTTSGRSRSTRPAAFLSPIAERPLSTIAVTMRLHPLTGLQAPCFTE